MAETLKIPFFRLGKWQHPQYGTIEGTQDTFDSFKNNFRQNVLGRPPFVRLGHTKDTAVTYADAPAVAWVNDIIQDGDILYALAKPTSNEILEDVINKKYRFASAEFSKEFVNKETGVKAGPILTAIALTNEPFLTRLPDVIALASHFPGSFYLDYGEVEDSSIKRLTDSIKGFLAMLTSVNEQDKKEKQHSQFIKRALDTVHIPELKNQISLAQRKREEADRIELAAVVESRMVDLIAKGVPAIMCQRFKEILLSTPNVTTTMVKMADGRYGNMAEQLFTALEAIPEKNRIAPGQIGGQGKATPTSLLDAIAYEDVIALGGTVTKDGRFILEPTGSPRSIDPSGKLEAIAREDVIAMGGTITEDGKYKL